MCHTVDKRNLVALHILFIWLVDPIIRRFPTTQQTHFPAFEAVDLGFENLKRWKMKFDFMSLYKCVYIYVYKYVHMLSIYIYKYTYIYICINVCIYIYYNTYV